jgi:putative ABC transport system permease protein
MRMARRELRRRPWRTALVALMVLLPCLAMTLATTALRTSEWSEEDELTATWGQTDANASWFDQGAPSSPPPEALDELAASLPEGSRLVVEHFYADRVRVGDDRFYFDVLDFPLDDPMAAGRMDDVTGRYPTTADEVLVSRDLAERMDLDVGSTMHPDRLGREVEVVGIGTLRGGDVDRVYLGAPLEEAGIHDDEFAGLATTVLVDLPGRPYLDDPGAADPLGDPLVDEMPARGWQFNPIVVSGSASNVGLGLFWTYVMGGVGLVVLGTVITAAFAISARRQLHTVGLLSATGAAPRTVKRFLIAQGALTGAAGAVIGITIGLVVCLAIPADRLRDVVGHQVDGVTIPFLELIPILLIGTLGAAAAAAIPARSAAQVSTLQALAGRRPLPRVPARMPLWGVVALVGGAACFAMAVSGSRDAGSSLWALVAVVGALATLAGVCFISPWVVAHLDGLSTRWPHAWRLAGRSLARNRVRSSAVIGAVAAVGATLVAGTTLASSNEANQCCSTNLPYIADNHVLVATSDVLVTWEDVDGDGPLGVESVWTGRPGTPDEDVIAEIDRIIPDARHIPLTALVPEGTIEGPAEGSAWGRVLPAEGAAVPDDEAWRAEVRIGVADLALLDELGVPDDMRRAIADGEAVAIAPLPFDATVVEADSSDGRTTIPLAGIAESPLASFALPAILISEETAVELGYQTVPGPLLLSSDDPITRSQVKELDTLQSDLWWEQDSMLQPPAGRDSIARTETSISVPDSRVISEAMIRAGILAGAFLLMLSVVGVGLALAGKDSEDERQVLAAIGAAPRLLRRVGALRAVLLVTTAVVLAIPAGMLPAAAIIEASAESDPIVPDWTTIAFLVVLVPLATGLVVWVAGRLRDAVKPTRPAVFDFAE